VQPIAIGTLTQMTVLCVELHQKREREKVVRQLLRQRMQENTWEVDR
jgi:hypothetical protein